ncbi:arylsulfatase [Paraburkholderia dipogonis]|uniref:Arylsulfatase n=1 Tax=Paraburkholderia dipogonis TaxID=1211383 RepID=A0A4Y8MS09_9BURK|nr:sulfatase-like hydrolase/transferase [Paraburkholderia dipogonis]TFE40209.1 arylsulfatase [Paraburkholderia dipogonis]
MNEQDNHASGLGDAGRRHFLKAASAAVASAGVDLPAFANATSDRPAANRRTVAPAPAVPPKGYNILFILTDQERHFDTWPFPVPGRERLKRDGITFANHQIAACVCSPSRSTIYTGSHTPQTGVFDNAGLPWQPDMSTGIRTIGHMMRDAGYHAAYLGKWHLSKSLHETGSPYTAPINAYNKSMQDYGFDDYFGVGDLIGMVRGGYDYDGITAGAAVSWLRQRSENSKPWFLAVNLVNPHDVMFVDTDRGNDDLQNRRHPLLGNARPPRDVIYDARWNEPLSVSRRQPYDAPGRPAAHGMYNMAHANLVGGYPLNDERIKVYQDYYFNCIRDCDRHIERLLDALVDMNLDDNTIVVMSSDHGDHVGAHQLVGKGATAYREQNHVPLVIRHPAYPGGEVCRSLTSHMDLVPTLLDLTGMDTKDAARIGGKALKGSSLVPLLRSPENSSIDAVRPAALFCYAMLLYYDSEWMLRELSMLFDRKTPPEEIHRRIRAQQPDFGKRGAIRSVYDGRYRFSRYFSLMDFNLPRNVDELFAHNDVELYDLESDPHELRNLALERRHHEGLLLAMNEKLNLLIDAEIGKDNVDGMPIRDGKVQFAFHSHA